MADWLDSTARTLRFIGGVPRLIVPDNPRALIAVADRYEPQKNATVQDFARHYGTSFLPARPYHPQDKAKVESAVQVVERWVLARLRQQTFASLHEVNQAIEPLLKRLNERPFQKLPGSHASVFAQIDAPALQPLPLQPYELAHFKTAKVHIDYHVEIEQHRYSVPHALVGQTVEARITASGVELLHHGQRVTSHARNRQRGGFTTVAEPMPTAHRAHLEWTPQRLIHWGQGIGRPPARPSRGSWRKTSIPNTVTAPVSGCSPWPNAMARPGWKPVVGWRSNWGPAGIATSATFWPITATGPPPP
jgi:transposase